MSKQIDLTLYPKRVNIESGGYSAITVDLIGVETDSIVSSLDAKDIVSHFDTGELLETIGVETCKNYFDLKENK